MEKITADTLRDWLEDPGLFIMDVRSPLAWAGSTTKVKHAHRFDPAQLSPAALQEIPRDKKLVLY